MPECDLYKKALHIVVEGTETRMRYNGEHKDIRRVLSRERSAAKAQI